MREARNKGLDKSRNKAAGAVAQGHCLPIIMVHQAGQFAGYASQPKTMGFDSCQEASSRQGGALWTFHVISKCGIEVLATPPRRNAGHTEASRSLVAPMIHLWRRRTESHDCSRSSAHPRGNGDLNVAGIPGACVMGRYGR
ncbi:hypothetical protein DPSP01_008688 [Paraphaeosphaeria sporulosa]